LRTAVYVRCSTDRQHTDNQEPDIIGYLNAHNIPASEVEWFRENESSWVAGHQTELARLKDEIRTGQRKYDLFIVWAFDRLSRLGGIDLINQWAFFGRHYVKVISIKETWSDIPPEILPILLAMWGYLAQMESKRRSDRVKAGNARKAKEEPGWKPGRQKGARDKPDKRRRRAGYLRRYAREPNKLSEKLQDFPELEGAAKTVTN
jgi:putative DNA-invertase from lambdoid prophage Rac